MKSRNLLLLVVAVAVGVVAIAVIAIVAVSHIGPRGTEISQMPSLPSPPPLETDETASPSREEEPQEEADYSAAGPDTLSIPTSGQASREKDAPAAAKPPEWEYVTELLNPEGLSDASGFSERAVDFQGAKSPHCLRGGPSRRHPSGFFWKLSDLPAHYKATRLACTFAAEDASDWEASYRFEVRLNGGSPDTYHVKPGQSAQVRVPLDGVYRIDITAIPVGDGSGRPIIVEPKFYFR